MYKVLRNLLFLLPAETAHSLSMQLLKAACSLPPLRKGLTRYFQPSASPVSFLGLNFRNRVGLGAGFDKNARYLRELAALGFGFVEIGTVTPRPQHGNEKPRLFRLPQDEALVNRMGFNNEGVEVVAERLKRWRKTTDDGRQTAERRQTTDHRPRTAEGQFSSSESSDQVPSSAVRGLSSSHPLLIGGNIGKNKSTPNEEAWKDYGICFRALHPWVDFFVVNVSSPNTPGLRALQDKESLRQILTHLFELNRGFAVQRPILLKIAPDLSLPQVDEVIGLAQEIGLQGLVAANTTISRDGLQTSAEEVERIGAGGLSGRPLRDRSTELLRYISQKAGGRLPVIGSGGIFTARDAREKREAGADLVEVWTGFIYEGPLIVKKICKGLA